MKKYNRCQRINLIGFNFGYPGDYPYSHLVYYALENAFIYSYSDCGSVRKLIRSYLGDLL